MIEEVDGGILVILCGIEYSDAFLSIYPSLFHSLSSSQPLLLFLFHFVFLVSLFAFILF